MTLNTRHDNNGKIKNIEPKKLDRNNTRQKRKPLILLTKPISPILITL